MTLWSRLEGIAAATPGKLAVDAPDARLTYAGLRDAAAVAAGRLQSEFGVGHGDRVAYLGLNSAALLVLVFAASRAGFIVVPMNWRLVAEELGWIVRNAEPKVLIADSAHRKIAAIAAGTFPLADAADFSGVGERGPGRSRAPEGAEHDPLLLVYTSGATGRPKGTLLSQAAVMANARLSWDMHDMTAEDHVLTALPMFHVGGLNIQTLPALLCGARVTLIDRFEPGAALAAIRELHPTLTVHVPATFQAMIAHADWERTDFSSLRAIATGSTDVPVPLIEVVHEKGVPVIQIYGATETGPVVIYQKAEEAVARIGSIGRAGSGVDVQITGPDGRALPDGETGEIWLRSPTLATGYWRNPEADAAFADGWFRTGDVARRDTEGFFWFTDRIKNVIISGGENIYPAELERVLRAVAGIREAAVVGRADPKWGAVPVAVVAADGLCRAEVMAAFDGRLARFKHPKDVVFVEALPRNAMGKVVTDEVKRMIGAV